MQSVSSFPPDTTPKSQRSKPNKPSLSTTYRHVINDDAVRDVLVLMCRPVVIPVGEDPIPCLVKIAISRFQKSGNHFSYAQVENAVNILVERKLIKYHGDQRRFYPTAKTQDILNHLFIVLCANCGVSNIKAIDQNSCNVNFCHRCNAKL